MTVITTADLKDKKVMTQDGHRIGDVDSVTVDIDAWEVQHIRVKLRREVLESLSLERPLFGTQTVDVSVKEVAGISEAVILRSTLETLTVSGGKTAAVKPE